MWRVTFTVLGPFGGFGHPPHLEDFLVFPAMVITSFPGQ